MLPLSWVRVAVCLCLGIANLRVIGDGLLDECHQRAGLPNIFLKLDSAGPGPVRIAYLGGSITAQEGWRPKTLQWFQDQFPARHVEQINAAIGGTGSDLGVFRLAHDVLDQQPDLLFVEFAVNDGGARPAQIHRCMEGIVRQTWQRFPQTDICFVYTVAGNMLDTLKLEQLPQSTAAMESIAGHYGIPTINMGLGVARLEKAGKLVFKGSLPKTESDKEALGARVIFSPDGVHPFPETGHKIYFESVVRCLGQIRPPGSVVAQAGTSARPGSQGVAHALPAPFAADNWESAKLVPLSRAELSAGWVQLEPATNRLAKQFQSRLPQMWSATTAGESIRFQFRGTTVKIYDLLGPDCGQVTVKVDDQPSVVKPRFDSFCTYHRLATLNVAEGLPNTVHQVELTVHPEQPEKARILSQRNERIDDPKRFDGITWYAGAILVVGEVIEGRR